MAKTFFYIISIFILLAIAGFILLKGDSSQETNIPKENVPGSFQKVVLSQEDLNYKNVNVEPNKAVVISADSSVTGCLRSVVFNIEGKKYSKYLKTSEDTLQLPALERGTYTFSCSMGMGYGKLIVG